MFSPNSLLWGSLLGKKGWRRYALAASPELVRHLSALCPPCVCLPCLQSLSATCPPGVRLVFLALAASSILVRLVSAFLSASCPPRVRLVFLLLAAPPVLVGHLSARCLFTMSAFMVSGSPFVRLVSAIMSALRPSMSDFARVCLSKEV